PALAETPRYVDEVQRFLQRAWEASEEKEVEPDRVLATVLFTDIVGSSERAAALGDRGWRDVLQQHHELVRQQLMRHRGVEVDTAGDGFFASFDGPARAIRCASAITESVRELGLDVRAGPRSIAAQAMLESLGIARPQLELLGVKRRVRQIASLCAPALEELTDSWGRCPHRLVDDRPTTLEHPRHVGQEPVRSMNGAVEIVDEDRSRDPVLVPQASRRRDLVIEA